MFLLDFNDFDAFIKHFPDDIPSRYHSAVLLFIFFICRSGIEAEGLLDNICERHYFFTFPMDWQTFDYRWAVAGGGFRDRIAVWEVWFDIEHGGAVDEIESSCFQRYTKLMVILDGE